MPVKSPFDIPNLQSELQRLAFIGLGSNLGDAKQNVLRAMDRLQRLSEFPLLRSSLWRTTPVDCPPDSPEFVNAVVGLLPPAGGSPEGLLDQLQALGRGFGRQPKTALNEPRPLELDLISFRQGKRRSGGLFLAPPRAPPRPFVLQPHCRNGAAL